jgi:hypothetical protein
MQQTEARLTHGTGGKLMYDEQVKQLREVEEMLKVAQFKEAANMIEQAADAIEQLSNAGSAYGRGWTLGYDAGRDENRPRWIPVTERLPEHSYGESNSVLTVSSLGTMRVLYFDGGNWCYPTGEALTTAGKFPVTHWMPLPEPPKEET